MSKVILLDMDNVLMDFNGRLVEIYNHYHDDQITQDMITHWDFEGMTDVQKHDLNAIWKTEGFFKSLEPLNDAAEWVPKLMEKHTCYIASDAFDLSYREKDYSLEKYFPKLKDRKFYCRDKWMIKADVLLDDKIETLHRFGKEMGAPVCYNHYHNLWRPDRKLNWQGLRVSSMEEFYYLMKGL